MEVLLTRRLTLRPPLEVDADDIALHLSNWKVSRMLARVPFPYDRQDAADWIARRAASSADEIVFTIHRERLIGVIGIEGDASAPRLGYWLGEAWWGNGLMSEAVGAVLDLVFSRRPDAAVSSSVFTDNPASLRLQQRLGFRVTGAGETFSAARQAMAGDVRTELSRADFTGTAGALFDVAA
ncbi:MAG: GNAT family N-acetyltransferase [Rhizobiaceae bacterium]